MNKVITINLGGTAFQLEEAGYDALRIYLETATARLQGNPDQEEILSDIEWAMAEKFRPLLGSHKTVVVTREVTAVLGAMGPIEAESGTTANPDSGATEPPGDASGTKSAGPEKPPSGGATPRRLYRIHEGAMIAGVCNGMAAYANLDPTLIRLAFVFMTLMWGIGGVAYVIMAIVVPEACSPEEKAAASGASSTAQEFIRRAKEGYYEAIKGFPNRQARREWKRRFKRDFRANADQWRQQWFSHWAEQAALHPGMGFALPMISLLHGAVRVLWVCALVSLLATGALFGLALPSNVPVWVAALVLLFLYGLFVWPLKAARRACYWGLGRPGPAWAMVFLLDAVVWLAVVATLLWLALHYFPELREAFQGLPAVIHQASDDLRTWWKGK